MKKLISTAIIFIMIISLFLCGCSNFDDDYEKKLKDDVYGNYERLTADLLEAETYDDYLKYFNTWASKKNIFSKELQNCGLALSKPATDNYKNTSDVTFQCSVNLKNKPATLKTIAIALTVLEDSKKHGDLTVLITTGNDGAKNLPDKYLKTSNFINLTERSQPRLFIGGAATSEYSIDKNTTTTVPQGTKAYKFSITGSKGGDSADKSRLHPNPIMAIGNFLYEVRKSGVVLEIASFEGGQYPWEYPKDASVTVVVNSSEEVKFVDKMENFGKGYEDKHRKNEDKLEYSLTEVPLPEYVLSSDDTASILSLLYTLPDGIYATTEEDEKGDILALSTVGKISTNNNQLHLGVFVRSIDPDIFEEMGYTYKEMAGLSDAQFSTVSSIPLWPENEDNPLANSLIIAGNQVDLKFYPNSTFMKNDATTFYSTNNNLNIISVGINIQYSFDIVKTFIIFIESLETDQQSPVM